MLRINDVSSSSSNSYKKNHEILFLEADPEPSNFSKTFSVFTALCEAACKGILEQRGFSLA